MAWADQEVNMRTSLAREEILHSLKLIHQSNVMRYKFVEKVPFFIRSLDCHDLGIVIITCCFIHLCNRIMTSVWTKIQPCVRLTDLYRSMMRCVLKAPLPLHYCLLLTCPAFNTTLLFIVFVVLFVTDLPVIHTVWPINILYSSNIKKVDILFNALS